MDDIWVMVTPMDDIWIMGRHVIVGYSLLVTPMDDTLVIGQSDSCIVSCCRILNESEKMEEIYKHIEVDGLRFCRWSDQKHAVVNKCKEMRNKNILFRDGLLFFLEVDHKGITMLKESICIGTFGFNICPGNDADGRRKTEEAGSFGHVEQSLLQNKRYLES
ncbi:unnamed protein product [Lactuca saligna]|uniref:Uncharacterized protein n=1 Tax=Lactuca saligna TaxID=75948 RepID=A0AA36E0S7_LACSI|nr:unnamed protein product [Lactuca saligna]